jgi:hypothetical protein
MLIQYTKRLRTKEQYKKNGNRKAKKGTYIDWLVLFAMWPQINKMPLVYSRLNILFQVIYTRSSIHIMKVYTYHKDWITSIKNYTKTLSYTYPSVIYRRSDKYDVSLCLYFLLFYYSVSVVHDMVYHVRLQSPSVDCILYIIMGPYIKCLVSCAALAINVIQQWKQRKTILTRLFTFSLLYNIMNLTRRLFLNS